MRMPRVSSQLRIFLVLSAILLIIPLIAAAVGSQFPQVSAVSATRPVPPLPERDQPLPGFSDLIEHFPLVASDLPDVSSTSFIDAYDRTTLYTIDSNLEMLEYAAEAIPVPEGSEGREIRQWRNQYKRDTNVAIEFPESVFKALQIDPLNGDRLSNLAVAWYYSNGALWDPPRPFGLTDPNPGYKVLTLLEQTVRYFPESRVAVLNYAYFGRLWENASILEGWIENHPDDLTAISIAVWLRVNGNDSINPAPYLNLLAESDTPQLRAIGNAWLGDLHMSLSVREKNSAPFTAQHSAWQAIAFYDRALEDSDEPNIYAARSSALELLGYYPEAIETQQRAVELAPDSVTLRLRLAEIYTRAPGTTEERLATLREAQSIQRNTFSLAMEQHDAHISNVYYWLDPYALSRVINLPIDYASGFPQKTYIGYVPYGGAGGYAISMDLIPKVETRPDSNRRPRFQIERAVFDSVQVSIALGDPEGIASDFDILTEFMGESRWGVLPYNFERYSNLESWAISQAQIVTHPDSAVLDRDEEFARSAISVLRWYGLNETAAGTCRLLLDEWQAAQSWLLPCIAENAYLAGDITTARNAYEHLELNGEYEFRRQGEDLIRAAFVAQVDGDLDEARRLYEIASTLPARESDTGLEVLSFIRLGDVYLEMGEPLQAIEMYDRALPSPNSVSFDGLFATLGSSQQYAMNNRGIARMMVLKGSKSGVTCSGTNSLTCDAALADFNAVLRADPYNPLFMMNKSWVLRLLGQHDDAAEQMSMAVEVDPGLYPALNDLGVIAALDGDSATARGHFLAALAINPNYDHALWNLGMLEMQSGFSGFFRGQSYVARSILLNPSLSAINLDYRFDDSIYRVEVNDPRLEGSQWSFATTASITMTAFGFMTLLVLAFRLAYHFGESRVQDFVSDRAQRAAARIAQWSERFPIAQKIPWSAKIALTVSISILIVATVWTSRGEIAGTAVGSAAIALYAVATALVIHELGHTLMAHRFKAQLESEQWVPGLALSLAFLPVNLHAGPFPGQRVTADNEKTSWLVYLGGPLANFIVGILFYSLYYFQPVPGLRLMAIFQFSAAAYALLPFSPLDGEALARTRPLTVSALALAASIIGLLFSTGIL